MSNRAWQQSQQVWSPARSAMWTPRQIPDTDPELSSCNMRAFADATRTDLQGIFFGVGAAAAAATRLLEHMNTDDEISEWLDDQGWSTSESVPFSRPAECSMGNSQTTWAIQGFNSTCGGKKIWTKEEIAARPGRLLRVEALLRALIEE